NFHVYSVRARLVPNGLPQFAAMAVRPPLLPCIGLHKVALPSKRPLRTMSDFAIMQAGERCHAILGRFAVCEGNRRQPLLGRGGNQPWCQSFHGLSKTWSDRAPARVTPVRAWTRWLCAHAKRRRNG